MPRGTDGVFEMDKSQLPVRHISDPKGRRALTNVQVQHIRDYVKRCKYEGWGWPGACAEIASDYGVSKSTVTDVVNYRGAYAFVVVLLKRREGRDGA